MNLFTYGSLMFEEVWLQLVRRDCVRRPARLYGFTRRQVRGDVYPVVFRSRPSDWVDGVVYFDVGEEDFRRLDAFEGAPYDRQTHTVIVEGGEKHRAEAYVLRETFRHLIGDRSWDPSWFATEGLAAFLDGYRGFR